MNAFVSVFSQAAAIRLMTVATFVSVLGMVGVGVASCCESKTAHDVIVVAACQDGGDDGLDVGGVEEFLADKSEEAVAGLTPCAKACKRLSDLSCPESQKLPGGRTCVETCKAVASISSFSPTCVSAAKDVAAVRKCPEVRCLQK